MGRGGEALEGEGNHTALASSVERNVNNSTTAECTLPGGHTTLACMPAPSPAPHLLDPPCHALTHPLPVPRTASHLPRRSSSNPRFVAPHVTCLPCFTPFTRTPSSTTHRSPLPRRCGAPRGARASRTSCPKAPLPPPTRPTPPPDPPPATIAATTAAAVARHPPPALPPPPPSLPTVCRLL